jgi:CysZ protein
MLAIFRAYTRALRSLFLPGLLRHFAWPVLASVGLWLGAGIAFWGRLSRAATGLLQRWPALRPHLPAGGLGEQSISSAIHLGLYFVSLPLMFVTAVLLLESVALPMILDKVARVEYPQVEMRKGGSQMVSIKRTVISFLIAIGLIVVTLPLWLVPGFGAAFSCVLSAWLNHRSFSYDVLMKHADAAELVALPQRHRVRLFLLALGAATLTLVPVVNLLAVPFAGLSFAHYLLHELDRDRTRPGDLPAVG